MSNIFEKDDENLDSIQLKFLETLIEKLIKRLEEDSYKPRVQDALKAIQLKQKLVKTSEAEKSFWDMIEEVRQEELPKLYPEEPLSLETQIQNTIIGLKYQVKNGTLPIKIITDTFNQGRSKESQLSYRRIGQLLSNMGFRKAKTHASTYAILWDDDLLSNSVSPDVEESEKQLSPYPACPASPASPDDGSPAPNSPLWFLFSFLLFRNPSNHQTQHNSWQGWINVYNKNANIVSFS